MKFNDLEKISNAKQISDLKEQIKVKDTIINGLELRVNDLEKEHQTMKKI